MDDRKPDPTLPLPLLASLLALAFDGDTTDPPDWMSAGLLNSLDVELIQNQKRFEDFAVVCALAGPQCADPTGFALLLRGNFNGLRRVPNADSLMVFNVGKEVGRMIRTLLDSDRKRWLLGMHAYDMGILCRDVARFEEAARYQHLAAEQFRALDDVPSATISTFLVAVEEINYALQRGNTDDVTEALNLLDAAYQPAQEALQNHGWFPNVPIHLLLAHAWAGDLNYEKFDEHAALFFSPGANPRLAHWHGLVSAMQLIRDRDQHEADKALDEIIRRGDADRDADTTLTARLLKAWHIRGSAPNKHYEAILAWTGLKGRVVMAIAQRELASLHEEDV